jgi:hypothetical protein
MLARSTPPRFVHPYATRTQVILRDQLKSVFDTDWGTLFSGCEDEALGTVFTAVLTTTGEEPVMTEVPGLARLKVALEERLEVRRKSQF